uniref:Neur_chan_LBD domain-containing protein n=1 Tax=Macrostomum lignano TaxID=282301 RepID=A0A1I8FDA8_9PLAT
MFYIGIYIIGFYSISEATMDYSLTIYLRQQWTDPRLKFNSSLVGGKTQIKLEDRIWEKIWVPDVFLRNEKKADFHSVTIPNRFMNLESSGRIWYVINRPHNGHCRFLLAAAAEAARRSARRSDHAAVRSARNSFEIIYIPTMLIVILSWFAFWLNIDAVPARASGSKSSLPKVSYIKAIDVWMSACLGFVFASLLEFAVVNVYSRHGSGGGGGGGRSGGRGRRAAAAGPAISGGKKSGQKVRFGCCVPASTSRRRAARRGGGRPDGGDSPVFVRDPPAAMSPLQPPQQQEQHQQFHTELTVETSPQQPSPKPQLPLLHPATGFYILPPASTFLPRTASTFWALRLLPLPTRLLHPATASTFWHPASKHSAHAASTFCHRLLQSCHRHAIYILPPASTHPRDEKARATAMVGCLVLGQASHISRYQVVAVSREDATMPPLRAAARGLRSAWPIWLRARRLSLAALALRRGSSGVGRRGGALSLSGETGAARHGAVVVVELSDPPRFRLALRGEAMRRPRLRTETERASRREAIAEDAAELLLVDCGQAAVAAVAAASRVVQPAPSVTDSKAALAPSAEVELAAAVVWQPQAVGAAIDGAEVVAATSGGFQSERRMAAAWAGGDAPGVFGRAAGPCCCCCNSDRAMQVSESACRKCWSRCAFADIETGLRRLHRG